MDYYERLNFESKSFVGYDQKEVKKEILLLQNNYNEKKKQIIQSLEKAKNDNKALKEEWKRLNEQQPDNILMEDINSKFMKVFIEHTQAIKSLKSELDLIEKTYNQAIKLRKQKREQAEQRILEATAFLKTLQVEYTFNQEE